jgi:hypothetical protein
MELTNRIPITITSEAARSLNERRSLRKRLDRRRTIKGELAVMGAAKEAGRSAKVYQ